MDNVDKHRAAGVTFEVMPWPQWDREAAPLPDDLAQSNDWPLDDWMKLEFAEEPGGRGVGALVPVMALPIVRFEGLTADVPDPQRWLWSETKRMIDYIATGQWSEPGFERVLPEPNWWTEPPVPAGT